jgi:hypothetical protein
VSVTACQHLDTFSALKGQHISPVLWTHNQLLSTTVRSVLHPAGTRFACVVTDNAVRQALRDRMGQMSISLWMKAFTPQNINCEFEIVPRRVASCDGNKLKVHQELLL